jgi:hypothetical protein
MADIDREEEEDAASVAAAPTSSMEHVLKWIGFDHEGKRRLVLDELGEELNAFYQTTTKELDGLVKTLATRPLAGRVSIGFQRLKKLKAVIHWAQDRHRIGLAATVDLGDDEFEAKFDFLEELAASTQRQIIREQTRDSLESRARNASPGHLKDESKFHQWEATLIIMLGILQGVNGVPLSYVVREKEHEDGDVYENFVDECIARAKHKGPEFDADALLVHQILQSLTIGEHAEHWLKDISKKHDGRKDMIALRAHYRGAGNKSRRIQVAKKQHATLHYKNERALKFSIFISQAKEMFNIFEECGEPYVEAAKLRFLWENIQCPQLQGQMDAMKVQLGQDATLWTFVSACDQLAAQVPTDGASSKTKFTASALGSGTGGGTKSNIMKDGKLHTGTYTKEEWWDVLTKEERNQVMAARQKSGGSKGTKKYDKKKFDGQSRKIKALEKTLKEKKKKISSMQRVTFADDETSDSDSSAEEDNAGSAFGGRAEKQKQRAKKKRKKN